MERTYAKNYFELHRATTSVNSILKKAFGSTIAPYDSLVAVPPIKIIGNKNGTPVEYQIADGGSYITRITSISKPDTSTVEQVEQIDMATIMSELDSHEFTPIKYQETSHFDLMQSQSHISTDFKNKKTVMFDTETGYQVLNTSVFNDISNNSMTTLETLLYGNLDATGVPNGQTSFMKSHPEKLTEHLERMQNDNKYAENMKKSISVNEAKVLADMPTQMATVSYVSDNLRETHSYTYGRNGIIDYADYVYVNDPVGQTSKIKYRERELLNKAHEEFFENTLEFFQEGKSVPELVDNITQKWEANQSKFNSNSFMRYPNKPKFGAYNAGFDSEYLELLSGQKLDTFDIMKPIQKSITARPAFTYPEQTKKLLKFYEHTIDETVKQMLDSKNVREVAAARYMTINQNFVENKILSTDRFLDKLYDPNIETPDFLEFENNIRQEIIGVADDMVKNKKDYAKSMYDRNTVLQTTHYARNKGTNTEASFIADSIIDGNQGFPNLNSQTELVGSAHRALTDTLVSADSLGKTPETTQIRNKGGRSPHSPEVASAQDIAHGSAMARIKDIAGDVISPRSSMNIIDDSLRHSKSVSVEAPKWNMSLAGSTATNVFKFIAGTVATSFALDAVKSENGEDDKNKAASEHLEKIYKTKIHYQKFQPLLLGAALLGMTRVGSLLNDMSDTSLGKVSTNMLKTIEAGHAVMSDKTGTVLPKILSNFGNTASASIKQWTNNITDNISSGLKNFDVGIDKKFIGFGAILTGAVMAIGALGRRAGKEKYETSEVSKQSEYEKTVFSEAEFQPPQRQRTGSIDVMEKLNLKEPPKDGVDEDAILTNRKVGIGSALSKTGYIPPNLKRSESRGPGNILDNEADRKAREEAHNRAQYEEALQAKNSARNKFNRIQNDLNGAEMRSGAYR